MLVCIIGIKLHVNNQIYLNYKISKSSELQKIGNMILNLTNSEMFIEGFRKFRLQRVAGVKAATECEEQSISVLHNTLFCPDHHRHYHQSWSSLSSFQYSILSLSSSKTSSSIMMIITIIIITIISAAQYSFFCADYYQKHPHSPQHYQHHHCYHHYQCCTIFTIITINNSCCSQCSTIYIICARFGIKHTLHFLHVHVHRHMKNVYCMAVFTCENSHIQTETRAWFDCNSG